MIEQIEQIINNKKQIDASLSQRGLTGISSPQLLTEARDIMRRKIEVNDPQITGQMFRRAQGLLGSIGRWTFEIEQIRANIAKQFQSEYPQLEMPNQVLVATAYLLEQSKSTLSQQDVSRIAQCITNSVTQTGAITLFSFTCPEVDYPRLTDGLDPNDFIRTTARKNTLSQNWQRNKQLFSQLTTVTDYPINLVIIVGELDEESYIFPVMGNFNTDPEVLTNRRAQYRQSLQRQAQSTYPDVSVSVIGWQELAPEKLITTNNLPSLEFVDAEMQTMQLLLQPDKYYAGILTPNNAQLRKICELKMRTYATQGQVIKDRYPSAVGLQNEIPSLRRTQMLNAGLVASNIDPVPLICPYIIQS